MISTKRKRIKTIILVMLIVFLLILVALILYNSGYIENIYNALKGEKIEKNIIDKISINDIELIYDEENNIYYFPIAIKDENKEQQIEIKIETLSNIKCKIEDKEFSKKININEKINYDKTIEISIESFLYKYNAKIKFTNLPVISLSYNENKINSNEYIYSDFTITDPNYKENNSKYQLSSDSEIRYRGSFTLKFEKKSFRIKLDQNVNFGLLGMRTSKTWILDAMATDFSSLRTKTSSDLWGNINKDIDTEKYKELKSEYVEVYINGKNNGLYLLKEVIDEDLLNLDKNTGVLIKGINTDKPFFKEYDNITSNFRTPFELKYPKKVNRYPKAWSDIFNKLKDYYSGNTSYDVINKTFYIENLTNYKIFLLILKAEDNYECKNMYYSIVDNKEETKVLITPWDLDLTLGATLSSTNTKYRIVTDITDPFGIKDDKQFIEYLKDRWEILSKSELSKERINSMLDNQYEYLTKAHALERENKKYYNIDKEMAKEDIKNWYSERFDVIDKYIKSL